MDFFESQDAARRKTGRLVFLFALAVVSIIVSVYAVVSIAIIYTTKEARLWHPELFLAVVVATVAVVTCGSLYKIAQLRGGGRVVAEALGGHLIPRDTTDPLQRKILNVVEEMAIASGTAVPPVYLMPGEKGINAFAAGYTPNDAVIGVTQGCIEKLTRSQLQGVIAHEFSHILNGDMRMNVRLIGILNGILIIGMIGYFVLRITAFSGSGRGRGSSKGGGGALAILAIGAGLTIVGFMGTLFGNLIKAAVSRQREYLADASAVQFTRDADSIAGALKQIGGFAKGSGIASPNAAEASHMFFAKALTSGLTSMFATHPRLEDRIRRIEPGWDGTYPDPKKVKPRQPAPVRARPRAAVDVAEVITGAAILAGATAQGAATRGGAGGKPTGSSAVSAIGRPTTAHVEYAASLIRSLPVPIVTAARESYGARAVIYAMLLGRETEVRRIQLEHLAGHADEGVNHLVRTLLQPIAEVAAEARLPLIDLTTAALRELTPSQYRAFRGNMVALIEADKQVSLFEWVLQRIVLRHLEPQFSRVETGRARYHTLNRLIRPCAVLLSALSHSGHHDPATVQAAFERARDHLNLPNLRLLDQRECGLAELHKALTVLDTVTYKRKRELIEAGVTCVSADKRITVTEGELLRGIADSLGCPMPPLLPGQPIA
ncbi:MAG: M48 family metallopeptidase [Acidobacteria bacterium]|nr:M48 family metallopeptidase [Acidobacteriota bacterium]